MSPRNFAQVEEDVQQVNLTRYSLFFPEKREFFLEGQGIFGFGGATSGTQSRGGDTGAEIPVLFFSRRIGLNQGQTVPVMAGARVAGKAGAYSIGALNIQTDAKPSAKAVATNFSVLRIKRDILRRSSIGIIATNRAPTFGGDGSNQAAGLDASLGFFDSLSFSGYVARTRTTPVAGKSTSYRARFDYAGDRYGLGLEHIMIGDTFDPEIGYVRRDDFRRSYANARFSPRTKTSRVVRKLTWQASMDYVTNADRTVVMDKEANGSFGIEFHSSDTFDIGYRSNYEFIPKDFTISPGVVVPFGGYRYQNLYASYTLGQQRMISGKIATATGSFYGGRKTEAGYDGRVVLTRRFALEPTISLVRVSLPYGDFTAQVISNRTIITPTPRMMISSLVQYTAATHSLSSSVRLRWEYRGGSEFFAVYTDGRETPVRGLPALLNRSIALKITRLIRF